MATYLNLRVTKVTREKLDALKKSTGASLSALVIRAVDMLAAEMTAPRHDIVIGFIRLDRVGEIDSDATCVECERDLDLARGVWMRVHAAGDLSGPVCATCATSE